MYILFMLYFLFRLVNNYQGRKEKTPEKKKENIFKKIEKRTLRKKNIFKKKGVLEKLSQNNSL